MQTTDANKITDAQWQALRLLALEASKRAYVPYSNYPVGAAGLDENGQLYSGCNVENAGYGVTLCAECGLISSLVRDGGGRIVAFSCCNAIGEQIVPCGRCRQLLWEHGGPNLLMDMPTGIMPMSEVLPQGFGPESLEHVAKTRNQH